MLVITRRLGEKLFIGDDITISVMRVSGNKVRLGIEAPDECLIRRAELLHQWEGAPTETGAP